MKRRAPVIAVILGVVSVAWSAPPVPLTSLHAVHALSNSDAAMYVAKHTRRQAMETAAHGSDSGPSRQDNG